MKILYAASTASHLRNFHEPYLAALRAEGHDVRTLARGEGVDYDIPFEKKFFSPKNLTALRAIRRLYRTEFFDAVICNTTLAAFYLRLAARGKKRPRMINFVHGYLWNEGERGRRAKLLCFCERLLRRRTDAILVMNAEDARLATQNRLCRGKVYETRGCGVPHRETDAGDIAAARRDYAAPGAYVLAFAGELSGRKNQEFLIRALPALRERIPGITLWLIGEGGARADLEELCRELAVGGHVRFLGQQKNPARFMAACNLYVSAAKGEGLPFNIVEALDAGADILASDIKGHTDILRDHACGRLYHAGDSCDFVNNVIHMHNHPGEIPAAVKRAGYECFSSEQVFPDTLSLLKKAVTGDED